MKLFGMVRWVVVLGMAAGCFVGRVMADGKYYPPIAIKKAPAIPTQRAALVWKNGVETLVVESMLDGEGQSFGWIIPVPSEPTQIEESTPGVIETLAMNVQPEVVNTEWKMISMGFWGSIFLMLYIGFVIRLVRKNTSFYVIASITAVVIVFMGVFVPSLGRTMGLAGVKGLEGIRVERVQAVGNYEVAVVSAESAMVLDGWLRQNGFSGLSGSDTGVVSDYIGEKWHFVAAKLKREGSGRARPHPISIRFPAGQAVYPMRLTGTIGCDVYVELYVIADQRASSDVLNLEFADRYKSVAKDFKNVFTGDYIPVMKSETYWKYIGHPGVMKLMWDGCMVSRLCGRLIPSQMRSDIVVRFEDAKPYREKYYSLTGALNMGIRFGYMIWSILLVVLAGVFWKRMRSVAGGGLYWARIVPWSLVVAVLASFAIFSTRSIVPSTVIQRSRLIYWEGEIFNFPPDSYFQAMSKKEIEDCIKKIADEPGLKYRWPEGDSPLSYQVIEDDRGIVLRLYSPQGAPYDYVLKGAAGTARPTNIGFQPSLE